MASKKSNEMFTLTVDGKAVSRSEYASITQGARYHEPRRARLVLGRQELGQFSQESHNDEIAVLAFSGVLEQPFSGAASLVWGHPAEAPIIADSSEVELPGGLVVVLWVLRLT